MGKPVNPYSWMQSTYSYNMRGSAYPLRYFYPFPVPPLLYQVELSVGGQQFNGKGKTRQAAKHDAAAKALRILQSEPPSERLEVRRRPSRGPWSLGWSGRVVGRHRFRLVFLRGCIESCA